MKEPIIPPIFEAAKDQQQRIQKQHEMHDHICGINPLSNAAIPQMPLKDQQYALAAGLIIAIDTALKQDVLASDILDENSPIRDGIRQYMDWIK